MYSLKECLSETGIEIKITNRFIGNDLYQEIDKQLNEKDFSLMVVENFKYDIIYKSTKQTKYLITLQYFYGNFSILPNQCLKIKGLAKGSKDLLTYWYNTDTNDYDIYNGTEKRSVSYEKGQKLIKHCYTNGKVLDNEKNFIMIRQKDNDLIKTYDEFMEERDKLFNESKGEIDLLVTKNIVKQCVFEFFKLNKFLNFTPILSPESELIDKVYIGQLVAFKPYKGKGYDVDVKSFYPSLWVRGDFFFPLSAGEYHPLTTDILNLGQKELPLGHYPVQINIPDSFPKENVKFVFRINHENWYTNYDIIWARKLHFEIVIKGPLYYRYDNYISGKELFPKYVYKYYESKEEGKYYAKSMLNFLGGGLAQYNKNDKHVGQDDVVIERVIDVNRFNKNDNHCVTGLEYTDPDDKYLYGIARMKPFLYAFSRWNFAKTYINVLDEIVYVNTDGLISKSDLENNKKFHKKFLKQSYSTLGTFKFLKPETYIIEKNKKKIIS